MRRWNDLAKVMLPSGPGERPRIASCAIGIHSALAFRQFFRAKVWYMVLWIRKEKSRWIATESNLLIFAVTRSQGCCFVGETSTIYVSRKEKKKRKDMSDKNVKLPRNVMQEARWAEAAL